MSRGINFGAGPGALPEEVLKELQEALWDWQGLGMSVLEIGHRTEPFKAMMLEAEQDFRDLLNIPKEYHVLFLGGSARVQFAMIPMNFLRDNHKADYVVTGIWSDIAYKEAQKYGDIHLVASNHEQHAIPAQDTWQMREDAAYLYYTSNETLTGLAFHDAPVTLPGVPLVADMTSDLLSKPLNIDQFGLIFASSQKNIAPAGLTMVVVQDDYLSQAMLTTPTAFHYESQAEQHSLYNTPPTFQVFMAGRMFKWLKKQGGLVAIEEKNRIKAQLLYDFIDNSPVYHNRLPVHCRSHTNVAFHMEHSALEKQFLEQAQTIGLLALKGHAVTGGLRASLYNTISIENVKTLIDFMAKFEREIK